MEQALLDDKDNEVVSQENGTNNLERLPLMPLQVNSYVKNDKNTFPIGSKNQQHFGTKGKESFKEQTREKQTH